LRIRKARHVQGNIGASSASYPNRNARALSCPIFATTQDDIVVAVGLVAATRRPTAEEEQSLSPLVLRAAPLRWRTKRSSPPRGGGGPRAHGAAAGRAPLRSRCAPTPPARWTWSPSSRRSGRTRVKGPQDTQINT
ncbi:unnamed protein product, partial [Prorocentrum cordatum]